MPSTSSPICRSRCSRCSRRSDIERATIAELEQLLRDENPSIDLDAEIASLEHDVDRFEIYRSLLEPLAEVKQSPTYHPEGDALYHSLQVFELARERAGYDEEFLLAALLHDVGKGIDPSDHVAAGVEARLNSAGVTMFTRASVVCAERTTATSSVNESRCSSGIEGRG